MCSTASSRAEREGCRDEVPLVGHGVCASSRIRCVVAGMSSMGTPSLDRRVALAFPSIMRTSARWVGCATSNSQSARSVASAAGCKDSFAATPSSAASCAAATHERLEAPTGT